MDFLKDMSVQEQTLWKKWEEFNKEQNFMDIFRSIEKSIRNKCGNQQIFSIKKKLFKKSRQ